MKIGGLEWDDENIAHAARHGISPSEVEDVCYERHIVFEGKYGRHILYGQSLAGGRYIKVVLERRHDDIFRPVTAYEMSDSEKQKYRKRMNR